jgi:PAS domain S-box-containing protein
MLEFFKRLARRLAGDALSKVNAALERQVKDRTAELAKANADLHHEREWFRTTLASIGDGVITTDIQGRVTFLNPVAQTLTGRTQAEANGAPLGDVFTIVNEQSRQPAEDPTRRALREGRVVGLANGTVLIAKDASERPIEDSAAPIRDQNGQVAGVVLVFRDASEQRRLEQLQRTYQADLAKQVRERTEDLRASEERFRLLVEGTKDYAIFLLDPTGRIVSWNPGAERIKQYRAEEIIGQHFDRFYPEEDLKARKPEMELRVAASEGKYEEEGWRLRKDGTRFWANVLITALRDEAGNLRGFSKVTRDITERKHAEENARRLLQEEAARRAAEQNAEAIRAHREQLRVTLESIGDGVIATDAAGKVTLLNPVAQALTGWGRHEAVGQPLERVFAIEDEQTGQPADNPALRVLREGGVVGLTNQTVLTARDGRKRPIDDRAAPIRDGRGNILGCVLIFRDATEQRARLRAEEALKEAGRRKDEFLATLAHELRNPLAPIRNAVQVMRLLGTADPKLQRIQEMIDRQVEQLTRLVDDLLDVSRITSGRVKLQNEPVELASVVARAVETSRPLIEERRHHLTVTLPPEAIRLEADPVRLAQILANLLNNSAKYTEEGGQIWVTAQPEGEEAVIRVRDTGIGIPTAMLPHIFEMFTQVDPSLGRSQGGLGIGLTLVKSLVELHAGTVQAHSAGPGQGSEFVVRLPLRKAARKSGAEEGPDHQRQPGAPASALRVLVVDDSRDGAESLALLLRLKGHDVRVAHDGLAALEAAQASPPDLAILDIGMPGMDGYELARRLRQKPGLGKLVLVALTGWGQAEDRRRSQEAGFNQHLTKPADPAALDRLLGEAKRVRA